MDCNGMGEQEEKCIKVFTLGHSNRTFQEFAQILRSFQITALADIRRYPTSRSFPHFNKKSLEEKLPGLGVRYFWFEKLGGRRHGSPRPDSPNKGLTSPGFRNYADYMSTAQFEEAVKRLIDLASTFTLALMCAERLYFRCHRRLLSDYLVSRGIEVYHIEDSQKARPHKLTPGLSISAQGIPVYPE